MSEIMEPEKVRQTLYLTPDVHETLRTLAFNERVSQQELFRQALDLLFRERGVGTYAAPENRKQKR